MKRAYTVVIASVVLAALAGGAAWRAQAQSVAEHPPLAALGTPQQCSQYSGLPAGWGKQNNAGMVHVAAGSFTFGTTLGYADERPAGDGKTHVAGFWIDQTEVTNAQFASFVAQTHYVTDAERQGGAVVFHVPTDSELHARPYAWWSWVKGADWRHPTGPDSQLESAQNNHPVTLVTQADALAYAHWLGRDLPTEAEWEYAGKAGHDGAKLEVAPRYANGKPSANYWQGVFPQVNSAEDGNAGLAAVGCYTASDFKLYDMIGNAWEWTRDAYSGVHQYHSNGDTAAVANQATTRKSDTPMVIKGGSFLCSPDYCVRYRASSREAQEADLPASHIGFRTILRG
ncbi:SUMF1/EgtB/PvdO family nonheme iron enzyme [Silvimonas sp. JCM 19000]